jgi:hypothetical protein
MVHVALLWRLRRVKAEDGRIEVMGYVEPFYLNFTSFDVLDVRDILVF